MPSDHNSRARQPVQAQPGMLAHLVADSCLAPPDLETMRATAARALNTDNAPGTPLPAAGEVDTLTSTLRGHLELLIPDVQQATGPRPESAHTYCALACIGEARQKLHHTPAATLEARITHARHLARSLNALTDHYEQLLDGTAS